MLLLSILAISLFVSLGFVQSASTDEDEGWMGQGRGRRRRKMHASGTWVFYPDHKDLKYGDDYTFILGNETGDWTGTFEGTDYAVFSAVKYPSGTYVYLSYGLIFFEGEVHGKEGTLVISFSPAVKTGDPMLWSGPWEIVSGTGELENLRGRGTWWEIETENIEYTGWIRFWDDDFEDD